MVSSKTTTHTHKHNVEGIFNIPQMSSLGKYLGCSIFQGRPSKDLSDALVEKSNSKLSNLKAKFVSKAGRVVLI